VPCDEVLTNRVSAVIEMKASMILQFIGGLRGNLARDLWRRNLGGLVVRPIEATRHETGTLLCTRAQSLLQLGLVQDIRRANQASKTIQ
jgi:hypothetical protein